MDIQLAISIEQCAQLLGCSRKHVYHLINTDPSFPQPFKLGRSTRILARAVREWVETKAADAAARRFGPGNGAGRNAGEGRTFDPVQRS